MKPIAHDRFYRMLQMGIFEAAAPELRADSFAQRTPEN